MRAIPFSKIPIGVPILLVAIVLFFLIPDKTNANPRPCALGECPKEITYADNGNVFTYKVNRRFNVILNAKKYPENRLTCNNDVLEKTESMADLYPNRMHRFTVQNQGSCVLAHEDFSVTIVGVSTTKNIAR